MKAFYATRVRRPDLYLAVRRLASFASKWHEIHDRALVKLIGKMKKHKDAGMLAKLDKHKPVVLRLWTDSDFAGEASTSKSCAGMLLEITDPEGKNC